MAAITGYFRAERSAGKLLFFPISNLRFIDAFLAEDFRVLMNSLCTFQIMLCKIITGK
ncbi:hypothetical protein [Butyrivibrio sp. VCD2006]|uniref:hypothetical protein n=1 Tax=Butyrivibrio sp. VCD2006 TaxID=1280664 RepID=UPI0012DC9C02|nr:hypothetical protein [Butyrivibrio sp. VCD2006]